MINTAVLLELIRRWEYESVEPTVMDGSEQAKVSNAIAKGQREAKRECADALRMLISLLGYSNKRPDMLTDLQKRLETETPEDWD